MAARAQTAILTGALALLAGLGALFLWLMRAPEREFDVAGSPPVGVAAPTQQRSEVEPLAPLEPVPPLERDSIASNAIDEGAWIEVQLRIEVDGRAAAGATLYVLGPRERRRWDYFADFERFGLGLEFLTRHGCSFSADAQGRARVPFLPGTLQLVAVSGEHFGMRSFELRSLPMQPLELSLRAGHSVEVRVRRAGDRTPIPGVAVRASRQGGRDALIGGLSDLHGQVRLWPLFEDQNQPNRWSASIAGILREEVRARFTLEDARSGVELVLPATGTAQVQLVDSRGEPLELPGKLELQWKDTEGDWAVPLEIGFSHGSLGLPLVELGLLVHVRAAIDGVAEKPLTKFQLEGQSSDTTRVELALAQAVPLVRARLLDVAGGALSLAPVDCDLSIWKAGETRQFGFQTQTRVDGRLTAALQGLELGPSTAAIVLRADDLPGRAALGGVFHAPMQAQTTNLGELRLEPAQQLFAGRVLDADARPCAGAFLLLIHAEDRGNVAAGIALDTLSDAQGNFELRGWSEDGLFEIEAQHGSSSGRARARRGDRDVQIRLR